MEEQQQNSKETEVAILRGIFKELRKKEFITDIELEELITELEINK